VSYIRSGSPSGAHRQSGVRTSVWRSALTSRPLFRTLVVVLQSMVGMWVRVELRNETSVRGKLEEVDGKTNMRLSQATIDGKQGAKTSKRAQTNTAGACTATLECVFVPGRHVRYVHLPDRLDVSATLDAYESNRDNQLLEYKRKKRKGKFATREEQEKQVLKKQAKLEQEMLQTENRMGETDTNAAMHNSAATASGTEMG
jgi:small nuclear ribonucleoprotein (snRNP)-like protein